MINSVTLNGRLTKDPELKATKNGKRVCSFCIAVTKNYKDENGTYQTNFINCVCWEQRADYLANWCRKGDLIGVVGEWDVRKYTANDGSERSANECRVDKISLLHSIANETQQSAPAPQNGRPAREREGMMYDGLLGDGDPLF